jgi:hypothetical protein
MNVPDQTKRGDVPDRLLAGLVAELRGSSSLRDNRIGRDLVVLTGLEQGAWKGLFHIADVGVSSRNELGIRCELATPGLVWEEGAPHLYRDWKFLLSIPAHYPEVMPRVRFDPPTPFAAHIVHAEHRPYPPGLPARLRAYLEAGDGHCCFTDHWSPATPAYDLALVVWMVSRIVGFAELRGERSALNPLARDHALRLRARGAEGSLGEPLPPPCPEVVEQVEADDGIEIEPAEVEDRR